jgi:hypothetical protein
VYRDDESTATGMSQQELLRRKARSVRRKRISSKPKKPIVQLPTQLLLPSRISAPLRPQYRTVEQSAVDEMSTRYRWNKSRSFADDMPEVESSSATAETTNESGESPPQLGTFAAAISSPSVSSRKQPILAVRGDDALLWCDPIDQRSLGEESFPILSHHSQFDVVSSNVDDNIIDSSQEQNQNVSSREYSSDAASHIQRGSVRFAENCIGAADDESSIPWDQKTDLKKTIASPSSVLENIDEEVFVSNKKRNFVAPKSILRSPRYKSTSPAVSTLMYYKNGRRVFGDESDRGLSGPNVNSSSYLAQTNNAINSQHLLLGADEPGIVSQCQRGRSVQEPIHSRELSPPRIRIGLLDSGDLELSPIRGYHDTPSGHAIRKVSITYGASHPAEKHLKETMATFLAMRDGGLADSVIEQGHFPDPPLEIDVSV